MYIAVVLGWYLWDWQGAIREYEKTRKLGPTSGCVNDLYSYGLTLAFVGRMDEALTGLNSALRLDPRSPVRRVNLGMVLYYSGRYDETAAEFNRAIELEPNFIFGPLHLGILYVQTGKYDQGIVEFQKLTDFRDKDA